MSSKTQGFKCPLPSSETWHVFLVYVNKVQQDSLSGESSNLLVGAGCSISEKRWLADTKYIIASHVWVCLSYVMQQYQAVTLCIFVCWPGCPLSYLSDADPLPPDQIYYAVPVGNKVQWIAIHASSKLEGYHK